MGQNMRSVPKHYRDFLLAIAGQDAMLVKRRDESYGSSWCKRGGAGAYFATIRKVDRIEEAVKPFHYDVFAAVEAGLEGDEGLGDGVLADIRDLRRYLLLWEAYLVAEGVIDEPPEARVRLECGICHNPARPRQDVCVLNKGHTGSQHVTGDGLIFSVYEADDDSAFITDLPQINAMMGGTDLPNIREACPSRLGQAQCGLMEGHECDHQDLDGSYRWTTEQAAPLDQCVLHRNHTGNHRFEKDTNPVEEKPARDRCPAARMAP